MHAFLQTSACAQPLADLNAPYYFVNSTGVTGASSINTTPVMPDAIVMHYELWGIVTNTSGGQPTVAS